MNKKEFLKNKLLVELMKATGKNKAISMAELYRRVFGRDVSDTIQDTRGLRKLITELRKEGVPIASTTDQNRGGYYTPVGSELDEYCKAIRKRALQLLQIEARIKGKNLPEVIKDIQLSLGA